ncbi:unnamed protein product [Ilex paraguariensis]|uniref:Uncharacterized protein n=1 Tax=Ilex paraguariensis TaxID=185542 RepID=A0ABC8S7F4_9AQUA
MWMPQLQHIKNMYSFASISSFPSLPPTSLAIGRHVLPYPVEEHGIARYTMLHGPRQSRLSHPHHVIGVEWCDLLSPHANTSLGQSIRVSINIDQDLKPCMEDERTIKLPKSHAMNGGDENYSYVDAAKELINEGVASKLDLKLLSSSSTINPFRIADFGCSTGPNTLLAMQIIVEAEEQKFKSEKPTTNSGGSKEVYVAYAVQFAKDLETFLNARAEELVGGGLMALLISTVPNVMISSETTTESEIDPLGSCLMVRNADKL